ncbi:MAG: hypothetical protein FJ386_05280 [Verrucomicrobia bacterium]|nr:hypothetical protein [Verrucomicrobiota bacterium]
MEFDWANRQFELEGNLTTLTIEESFEDPFVVRLLPDSGPYSGQARFFSLGKSSNGTGVFSVYRTNGKQVRVLSAREFEPEDLFFYQRRQNQLLAAKD